MKKQTNATIVILALLLCLSCSRYGEPEANETGEETKQEYPEQESWNSYILLTADGKRVARVKAGYIANYIGKDQTILRENVQVDFFDRDGQHSSVLTAEEGEVDNTSKNLIARGNVVVVSDSGVVLESSILRWEHQRKKIVSDVPVKITTATDTLVGDSFVSSPDLTDYEIRNARGFSGRGVPLKDRHNPNAQRP